MVFQFVKLCPNALMILDSFLLHCEHVLTSSPWVMQVASLEVFQLAKLWPRALVVILLDSLHLVHAFCVKPFSVQVGFLITVSLKL